MAKVLSGERPERPKHSILTDGLWNLTQRCLDQNPQRRPEITEVACGLQGIPVVWRDGMIPGSIRQREPLHRVPSPVAPFEVTPTRLKGPDSSMLLGRLWRRCKPNESSHQSRRSIRRIRQSEEPDISVSVHLPALARAVCCEEQVLGRRTARHRARRTIAACMPYWSRRGGDMISRGFSALTYGTDPSGYHIQYDDLQAVPATV